MIPMLAVVKVESEDTSPVRLWIPLILVWVLLAPFLILLSPLILIGAAVVGLSPFETVGAIACLIASMAGTRVEVSSPRARVFITVQ